MAGQDLVLLEQDPAVLDWRAKARTFKAEADALVIDSDEADAAATSMMGLGAAIARAAELKRVELKKPHIDEGKRIDEFFRRELQPFVAGRAVLEPRSIAWRKEKARRQAEADAAAERERLASEALAAEALRAEQAGQGAVAAQLLEKAVVAETTAAAAAVVASKPVETHVVTPMGASTMTKTWTFKVTSLAEVPREYLVLDEIAVRKAIRLSSRDSTGRPVLEIPGLEIYPDEGLAVRG